MNMSYCRFENTVIDLHDCFVHLNKKSEGRERAAKKRLIGLCASIISECIEYGLLKDDDACNFDLDEYSVRKLLDTADFSLLEYSDFNDEEEE